jgi:carbon monoxide dehydrogenase subunit G
VSVVIERSVAVGAPPAEVFAFLHAPDRRQDWDSVVDFARLEGDAPCVGARLHLRGRRTAPSWVGEYVEFDPPRRSVLRLIDGVGMPFSAFTQTIVVAPRKGGSVVSLRVEYQVRGPARALEQFTLRPRLAGAARKSLALIAGAFP